MAIIHFMYIQPDHFHLNLDFQLLFIKLWVKLLIKLFWHYPIVRVDFFKGYNWFYVAMSRVR